VGKILARPTVASGDGLEPVSAWRSEGKASPEVGGASDDFAGWAGLTDQLTSSPVDECWPGRDDLRPALRQ